jgi:uncharacterized protein (TIGR02117 family)
VTVRRSLGCSRISVTLAALTLAGCSAVPRRIAPAEAGGNAGPPVIVYVIKRSWHTDIGIAAPDLHAPLAAVHESLPLAHYLLFGFGDRYFLMHRGSSTRGLVGAVWPGAGLVLVTGLATTPEESFGAANVVRLTLSAGQARRLEEFIGDTLATRSEPFNALAPGPYDGSLYYASTLRYSGLHTCNTWSIEALAAAGLPVRRFGVEFSGQVWRQVRKVAVAQQAATQNAR